MILAVATLVAVLTADQQTANAGVTAPDSQPASNYEMREVSG